MKLGECLGYIDEPCPKCGRVRVERWSCGKHICEKCHWVIEDETYYREEDEYADGPDYFEAVSEDTFKPLTDEDISKIEQLFNVKFTDFQKMMFKRYWIAINRNKSMEDITCGIIERRSNLRGLRSDILMIDDYAGGFVDKESEE